MRSLADLAPFEIPSSWEWCRVGDLFSNTSGLAYKKDTLAIKADKMIRVLRGGNIGEEQFYFKGDDVFISSEFVKPELYLRKNYMITPAVSSLNHIGKIALIDKDYSDTVVGGFVLMLIPHFNDDVLSQYELPFEIPENWCWARLGSISSYAETKQKVNAANADSAIWGLDLEDIEKDGRSIVRKTVGERKAIGHKKRGTTESFP